MVFHRIIRLLPITISILIHSPTRGCPLWKHGEDLPSLKLWHDTDGETIWVHNETQAEFNEMGKFTGYRGTVQDITERKRWETDLLKSETKYRTLVENLQEGIWIIDRDANTTFVNEPMAKMLGYDEEEMMGRHLFNFMDESGVERAKQYLGRRKTGIAEQHDFEFLRKDGSKVFALIETTPLYNEGKMRGQVSTFDKEFALR